MDELIQRIQRLEEAQGFAEHTADTLGAEVRRAFEAVEALRKRVEAIERSAKAPDQPNPAIDAGDPEV